MVGQGGQEGLLQSLVLELELLGELVAVLVGSSSRSSWSENGLRTKATAAGSCLLLLTAATLQPPLTL